MQAKVRCLGAAPLQLLHQLGEQGGPCKVSKGPVIGHLGPRSVDLKGLRMQVHCEPKEQSVRSRVRGSGSMQILARQCHSFRNIVDSALESPFNVVRVQVYYELKAEREKQGKESEVALIRVEQLAPFPFDLVCRELRRYPNAEVMWCACSP